MAIGDHVGQWATRLVTPPAEPVVSDLQAQEQLRLDDDEFALDNDQIDLFIAAATELAQSFARRQFVTAVYDYQIDTFPGGGAGWLAPVFGGWGSCPRPDQIQLPRPRLQSVDSITYVDAQGVAQVMPAADYDVDVINEPGRVYPADGKSWPQTTTQPAAVTIRFTCGYGDADDVPARVKLALLMWLAHWYENREATIVGDSITKVPDGVDRLLWSFRTDL